MAFHCFPFVVLRRILSKFSYWSKISAILLVTFFGFHNYECKHLMKQFYGLIPEEII